MRSTRCVGAAAGARLSTVFFHRYGALFGRAWCAGNSDQRVAVRLRAHRRRHRACRGRDDGDRPLFATPLRGDALVLGSIPRARAWGSLVFTVGLGRFFFTGVGIVGLALRRAARDDHPARSIGSVVMLAANGLQLRPGAGCHRIRAHALRRKCADATARQHELDAIGVVADVAAVRVPDARHVIMPWQPVAVGVSARRGPADVGAAGAPGLGGIVRASRLRPTPGRRAQREGYACMSPAQCGRGGPRRQRFVEYRPRARPEMPQRHGRR